MSQKIFVVYTGIRNGFLFVFFLYAKSAFVVSYTHLLGADGEVIPGAKQLRQEKTISTPVEEVTGSVFVTINGDVVEMPHKKNPIFVDVFDVYPFDMTKAGGTRLVTRINGEDKDFTEPVHDGDRIELFWES